MQRSFVKMQGLGNDFVVVDGRGEGEVGWFDRPDVIVGLCDRHRGIGADGVLLILQPTEAGLAQGAHARMRIRNADGSVAEMCGNGLRCVAKRLLQETPRSSGSPLRVETLAGVLSCAALPDGHIEVAMETPTLLFDGHPQTAELAGQRVTWIGVSLGNPHAVVFCEPSATRGDLLALAALVGPHLEHHPLFPARTNAEWVAARGEAAFDAVVWERGCGITQACGTGACAVAVADRQRRHLISVPRGPSVIRVTLPGGTLEVRLDGRAALPHAVYLRGPAEEVFSGIHTLPATADRIRL